MEDPTETRDLSQEEQAHHEAGSEEDAVSDQDVAQAEAIEAAVPGPQTKSPISPTEPADAAGRESPQATSEKDEAACVEALLFASDAPLKPTRIAQAAGIGGQRAVTKAVNTLNDRYDELGCAFRIEAVANGYQMLTRPEYNDVLKQLVQARSESRLSQAALETLAIVAYRQPILRADVEAIRGVACGEVLRGLMEKQLIKIMGRAEIIGRPMLYGTTRRFLEVFGLKDLDDLPRVEELREPANPDRRDSETPDDEDEELTSDEDDDEDDDDDEDLETEDESTDSQDVSVPEGQVPVGDAGLEEDDPMAEAEAGADGADTEDEIDETG